MKHKIIRIVTVPQSFKLLEGQIKFMSEHFHVKGLSSPGKEIDIAKERESVDIIELPMKRKPSPIHDLISIIKLYRILRKEKPQIVHTHTPKAGLVGMTASYLSGVPIRLHTVAGLPLMIHTGMYKKLLVFIEKITYAFATKVYPNSIGIKDYIMSQKLLSPKKLSVIGNGTSNGINLDHYHSDLVSDDEAKKLKASLGITKSDFVFLAIGRIVKDKGVEELLDAYKLLLEKHTQTKLVILGEFEEQLDPISINHKAYLESEKSIITPGFQKDIRPFLKIANIFVHASYREGFPNVVLQAGAFNLPCVVTNINGNNEIIQDNINGLIVPVKDSEKLFNAMNQFLESDKLCGELSNKSRDIIKEKYMQSFVWEEILKEYNHLLKMNKNVQTIS